MNTLYEPSVIRVLREYHSDLIGNEIAQTQRLAASWYSIEQSLMGEMTLLAQVLSDAKESGSVITEQLIRRQEHYQTLIRQAREQILRFTKEVATPDISAEQLAYGRLGLDAAVNSISSSFTLGMGAQFNNLPIDAITDMVGFLGNGSPLNTLLREAYPDSVDGISKALIQGLAKGLSPDKIAYDMARGLGLGLERITLIARTEQLRVWRTSSQRQYEQSGVVLFHKRLAARDACLACLMADGEILPITQPLYDHPRGRCTSVPVVRGAPEPTWTTGRELFEAMDPEQQRELMGPGMFEAWKNGEFDLSQLVQHRHSDEWGDSIATASLKDLQDRDSVTESLQELEEAPRTIDSRSELLKEHYSLVDASSKEQKNYLKELSDLRLSISNDDEKFSLESYQGNSFSRITRYLRGEIELQHFDTRVLENISNIDSLFNKIPPLETPLSVFRGISGDFSKYLLDNLSIGFSFTDPSYVSTTDSLKLASKFSRGPDGMLLEIIIPENSRVLVTDETSQNFGEILLNRNSFFQVIEILEYQGKPLVRLQVINN